jgi:hypothetical protein
VIYGHGPVDSISSKWSPSSRIRFALSNTPVFQKVGGDQ